ncbi:MAG: HRDC domain-containing protein [Planctomycetaceae bacterium]|nr:HRDC domain-containing protein [Planctomycetaceae bacterium]
MSLITSQSEFNSLCEQIRKAGIVAFDTEFVAESYYRPRLCLLQFGLPDGEYCVDPFEVRDLSAWWDLMADEETTIIIHGGREEVRFCHFATQRPPGKLIDVQISEGLLSRGFPMSYGNLVQRVLGAAVHGKETRSDWERRPLTTKQLEYAAEDVRHLISVWKKQEQELQALGRLGWAWVEFGRFVGDIVADEHRDGWLKLPAIGRLRPRELAIAQALFHWRDRKACGLDKPPRFILRDDLLMEMAKRAPKTVKELNMTRGMNRRDYQRLADEMLEVIHEAQQLPDDQLPPRINTLQQHPKQDEVLGRILGLALANRCQELGLSMSLVGTTADLQAVVRWYLFDQKSSGPPPKLLDGWRKEVCGSLLTDVLSGDVVLRVANPRSDDPLRFERRAK